MDRCVRCGAELGVGRFCLNCGHPIGEPAPDVLDPTPLPEREPEPEPEQVPAASPSAVAVAEPTEALPVGAADPTPVPGVPWDPRRELLPYREVDDTGQDTALRGYAWIAWVVGAVLLVGLVFILLRVYGTDSADDNAADPASGSSSPASPGDGPASTPPEDAAAQPGVGKKFDMASRATFAVPATAEPTTDLDGTLVAYEASQMGDGNPSTTWRMAGDASGQTVTITLAEPGVVSAVGLVNGYSKQVGSVDWYPNNRRILTATWTFDDGSTVDQTFAERPGLQRMKVPPVETATVAIRITSVTPPGLGNLGRDYTAISEVSVIGRRAG